MWQIAECSARDRANERLKISPGAQKRAVRIRRIFVRGCPALRRLVACGWAMGYNNDGGGQTRQGLRVDRHGEEDGS